MHEWMGVDLNFLVETNHVDQVGIATEPIVYLLSATSTTCFWYNQF